MTKVITVKNKKTKKPKKNKVLTLKAFRLTVEGKNMVKDYQRFHDIASQFIDLETILEHKEHHTPLMEISSKLQQMVDEEGNIPAEELKELSSEEIVNLMPFISNKAPKDSDD
jgi:hypothetical protein